MNVTPRRIAAFKLSLLASLGVLPLACGGSSTGTVDDETAGTTGTSGGTAGTTSTSGGTGGTTQTGTAGTKLDGGAPAVPTVCTNPKADPLTGLVTCAEGYQHRPKAIDCQFNPTKAYPGGAGASSGGSSSSGSSQPRADGTEPCASEPSICDQYEYGYCPDSQVCLSGCVNDFDCATGEICVCDDAQSPTGGSCRRSACTVDAECGPGMLCATFDLRQGHFGPAVELLACQSPGDTCAASADCQESYACEWNATTQTRACEAPCPACGRPFLIEATARLAPTTSRRDWSADHTPSVAQLSAAERASQAEHWSRLGQMEHASIAAFARFSLQLLSLGAPPELVEACTNALADETAHTKLCFGIASAYAGRAIGPGPLDISGSLDVASLEDIVDLVIAEGCFGETSAALEALEAADDATDPVIRAAYTQIAADEQRHAELAFHFVRWALVQNDVTIRSRIEGVIAMPSYRDASALSVAVPCLQALLQATPPAPAAARAPAGLPAI
jgi:hypothetical protein